jgi:hypothetical protein
VKTPKEVVDDAIEFANDGGWHVGDEKARLRYLVSCFNRVANWEEREALLHEVVTRDNVFSARSQ